MSADYRTERVLAERGGVRVTIVRDRRGRRFVLKHLCSASDAAAQRIRAEAGLLSTAQGSGVIGLHAATRDGIVLEYAEGGSLADRLHTPLPVHEAVRIASRLSDVLRRLHARGTVHRDVKPSNILFTASGDLRLADFGVAARIGSRGTLGDGWEELRVGTPPYAVEHPSTDPATDRYALGVVLYEMLTARLPWEPSADEDDDAFTTRIRYEPPTAPSAHGVTLPPALEAAVMQAIEEPFSASPV